MPTQLTPQLLRTLRTASHASKHFIIACKRALDSVIGRPDLSLPQSQSQADSSSQQQQQDGDKDLTEEELRAWREGSEPLQKVLPQNTIYFIPYTLLPSGNTASHTANDTLNSSSAAALLSQIDAINLALTLEMFLPSSTRAKYPMLTTQVPFIDTESTVDGASLVASSQSQEHSSFILGASQPNSLGTSSQLQNSLTKEQQLERLTLPLDELKSVYLRLCAGRKEKHVLYVLRRVILEVCCISIITSTKARGLKTFKPQGLLDTFQATFLKDPALVKSDGSGGGGEGGGGSAVFATREIQEKACKLWEKWAGDIMHRFQTPLAAQNAYTWDALADTLLTDLLRHVLPAVLEKLEMEGTKTVALPTSTANAAAKAAPTGGARTMDPQKIPRAHLPPPTENGGSKPPADPERAAESRLIEKDWAKGPSVAEQSATAVPSSTTVKSTTTKSISSSTTAAKAGPTPATAQSTNVEKDEFGPRLVNPAHKGPVVLPDMTAQAPATGIQGLDMMDYIQNLEDVGNAGDLWNGDGGRDEEEPPFDEDGTPFGQEPSVPAPRFAFTRIPQNFRFNAPQQNAVKAVMTPSPEVEDRVWSLPEKGPRNGRGKDGAGEATKSTLRRMKAAVVSTDRGRGRTASRGTSVDPVAVGADEEEEEKKRSRKRKPDIEEEAYEEAHGPRAKKRKGTSGKAMPPPAGGSTKPKGASAVSRPSATSTTNTLVDPQPYAARHSSASSTTLFDPSRMAGPSFSTGVSTGAVRAVPPATTSARRPVIMADTDSSDGEVLFRCKKTTSNGVAASEEATVPSAPAPPAKSTAAVTSTAGRGNMPAAAAAAPAPARAPATVQSKPDQPYPLPAADELMKYSKERLSKIKDINEKNKKMYAALVGKDEDGDSDATEEDSEKESEELRKFRERRAREARGELRVDDELEKFRMKLEDLKKRSKEVETLPVRKRAKKLILGSSEDEERGGSEWEGEPVSVPRPRGRPRKHPAGEQRKREKRDYQYAVGGNEWGRKKWTEAEDKTLLFALEAAFHQGELLRPWKRIHDLHGPDGTESKELENRNVVQIKDRARAIAEKYVREEKERPEYLKWISLSEKRVSKKSKQ